MVIHLFFEFGHHGAMGQVSGASCAFVPKPRDGQPKQYITATLPVSSSFVRRARKRVFRATARFPTAVREQHCCQTFRQTCGKAFSDPFCAAGEQGRPPVFIRHFSWCAMRTVSERPGPALLKQAGRFQLPGTFAQAQSAPFCAAHTSFARSTSRSTCARSSSTLEKRHSSRRWRSSSTVLSMRS